MAFGITEKTVRVRIFPDAGNAPSFTSQGGVAGVSRVSAGLFRIALQDAYFSNVEKQATYSAGANNVDLYAQFQGIANLGTSTPATVDVALKTGAVNTDAAAAAANNHIDVTLVFEDSAA